MNEEMTEEEIERNLISLERRGLVARQDGGESASRIIVEYRSLLERWMKAYGFLVYQPGTNGGKLVKDTRKALE